MKSSRSRFVHSMVFTHFLFMVVTAYAAEQKDSGVFTIRVRLSEAHGQFLPNAPSIPVEFSANIPLFIEVEQIVDGSSPWQEGSRLRLLVHSQAMMFGKHDFAGESYSFTFEAVGQDNWTLISCWPAD